jgi:hypothetical protein
MTLTCPVIERQSAPEADADADSPRCGQEPARVVPRTGGGAPPDPPPSTGDLIGEWFDWTPTSPLDMNVRMRDLL